MPITRRHSALPAESLRSARTLSPMGGIPVEYNGGTIPPPDERRSYS
jgi:hypothetical protein